MQSENKRKIPVRRIAVYSVAAVLCIAAFCFWVVEPIIPMICVPVFIMTAFGVDMFFLVRQQKQGERTDTIRRLFIAYVIAALIIAAVCPTILIYSKTKLLRTDNQPVKEYGVYDTPDAAVRTIQDSGLQEKYDITVAKNGSGQTFKVTVTFTAKSGVVDIYDFTAYESVTIVNNKAVVTVNVKYFEDEKGRTTQYYVLNPVCTNGGEIVFSEGKYRVTYHDKSAGLKNIGSVMAGVIFLYYATISYYVLTVVLIILFALLLHVAGRRNENSIQ